MSVTPKLFLAKVMHKRLFPKQNLFSYKVYYLALPLSQISLLASFKKIKLNRAGILSFHEKDYVHDNSLENFTRSILNEHQIGKADGEIILITLPRVFGYAFNPVSFYLCLDKENNLRAVMAEVHNTFGEKHYYLCVKHGQEIINADDILSAEKHFHVSPFLKREGSYKFRFDYKPEKLGIWIDYYDAAGEKELITSLLGHLEPLTDKNIRRAFWKYPLITFKTIFLIHLQAIKLMIKRIKYMVKPEQKNLRITITDINKRSG